MGNFTANFTYNKKFDGDNITIVMKRATVKDMQLLAPFMVRNESGEIKFTVSSMMEIMGVAKEILPNCIVSFNGCLDAHGNSLNIEQVVQETYFTQLIMGIIVELINQSMFDGGDTEKKSDDISQDQQGGSTKRMISSLEKLT